MSTKSLNGPVKSEEKAKAIDLAVQQIEKQFGLGSIMRLGINHAIVPVEIIPTGSLALDLALGVGGVPRGRIIEVFGPEGSGKTTLTSQIIANAQRRGGMAAFVDAEHAFDLTYAKKLGVDVDNLLISQPDTGEQALEITEVLIRSGALDVIVVDSVAALVPQAEINGEMGDQHVGLQARLMSQALRKLTGTVSKTKTCLIFTNQIRMKIGVMFGSPETTSGGNALKFYSSVRLDIRRIAAIKDGEAVTGSRTKVKVVKNKVAAPFKTCEFDIMYGEGISFEGDVIDIGSATGVDIVKKSGTWFAYGDERLGQGKEAARKFLKEHPAITAEIAAKVLAHYGVTDNKAAVETPVAEAGAASADIPVPAAASVDADAGDALAASSRKKPGSMRVRP
ncbi:MAG TPA: recombinase RecA [Candidatus Krumholzibacteria bacterium]|nr:recombinase RecA [Candidatus Krumholzibacteria bacterium]